MNYKIMIINLPLMKVFYRSKPLTNQKARLSKTHDLKSSTNVSGNTNTLAGNVPPKANLGDLRGLAGGLNGINGSAMIDGGEFDGAKAYKDSKVCNMLTMQEFHRRYHEETGITFASLYPGCIATTGLFREHIPLFRLLFPPFQKYITKGYVSEEEAGKRLAQVN